MLVDTLLCDIGQMWIGCSETENRKECRSNCWIADFSRACRMRVLSMKPGEAAVVREASQELAKITIPPT